MTVIALIPARGGSKAIPRKNIAPLGGRPLLAYTAAAASASRVVDRIILSTDDAAIAEVGRSLGLEVPFLRPAAVAGDATPMLAVLEHALRWLETEGKAEVEAILLLQPTSPFRRAHHIDEAMSIFRAKHADSVVSVISVPHQFTPASLMRRDGERLVPYLADGPLPTLRQHKEPLFARNGPAILALRPATIRAGKLYTDKTYPYFMDDLASLDIDGPADLRLAEILLAAGAVATELGNAP
jgi:CMP-N-acetylneuraminic acid synthetase